LNNFENQLFRLKEALGLSEEQEVAIALNMSKAALSVRKKRGAFPEEKLWALAQKRPDLKIDVLAVLTGISSKGHAELALHDKASALLPAHATDFDSIKIHTIKAKGALRYAALPARQRALLEDFDLADDVGKNLIEGTAKLAAKSAKKNI
jgi:transcriptional regulator with XRE-family HTH domain